MDSKRSIKRLIIAHLDGELKGGELKRLSEWVSRSDENAGYYAKIKDLWEASVADASRIAETETEWSRFLLKVSGEVKSNIFSFNTNMQIFYRFAAILVLGVLIGGLVVKYSAKQDSLFITSVAPKGSVSQMILADSTLVYLNAGSELRYSPETKQNKREVFLKGEAWFDVKKNPKKPFVVHTPYYLVRVTGTNFNVKAYEADSEITTTLEEGEVKISSSENLKMEKEITLLPGEQLVFNKNSKEMVIKEVDTKLFTSWKDNKLMFLKMSFGDLIILLERKYGVEIKVDNPDILNYHYTGTIKNESILEILEIIKHTIPIQYKIDGQEIHIYKN